MPLSLIGYRGTGKSTIAQQVAIALGWNWVDGDVEIELAAGKSIAAIFADDGEPAFRELESRVVLELCRRKRTVIALGGGAILRESNRTAIKAGGPVVWLQAAPETLLKRISADPTTTARRPNLTTAGGITEIIATLDERTPFYRECASLTVDTEGKTPNEVADEIVRWMQNFASESDPCHSV